MAAFKVFLLAFLACSALVNAEEGSFQKNIGDNSVKFEDIQILFKEMVSLYLYHLADVVKAESENINNQLDKTSKEIKNALEAFEQLQQDVQKYGEEFEKCATKQYPKIQQLFDEIATTQAACVKDSNEAVEDIRARLIQKLDAAYDRDAVVIGELQTCKSKHDECSQEGTFKLLETTQIINLYVREAIKEVGDVLQEISPEVISCVVAASDKFQAEMKKVYAEIQQCTRD